MSGPSKHPFRVQPASGGPTLVVDANSSRQALAIQNAGSVRCHLRGDNTVSITDIYLEPGDWLFDTNSQDDWYTTPVSGTGDLRGYEVY